MNKVIQHIAVWGAVLLVLVGPQCLSPSLPGLFTHTLSVLLFQE
jgi:hypothetical protein